MRLANVTSPAVDDASALAATGKSLPEWFAVLDAAGGVPKGRRELSSVVLAAIPEEPW